MKLAANIAAGLLGLVFIAGGLAFFIMGIPKDAPPLPAPAMQFMGALVPTGYLHFVKVFEVLGGLLVAIPRMRNWGLLVLGPILINILAFHGFLCQGQGLFNPVLIVLCLLAVFLLWDGRKAFLGLLR